MLDGVAVVFERPGELSLRPVGMLAPGPGDCVVDVEWSGISTGTERLLWSGRMPPFPGLAYPLVPGYESIGRVREAGADSRLQPGQRVFVPGSSAFSDVRGLFGGTAERLIVPTERVLPVDDSLGADGILLALAATAAHAVSVAGEGRVPELVVGVPNHFDLYRGMITQSLDDTGQFFLPALLGGCLRGPLSHWGIPRRWCGKASQSAAPTPRGTVSVIPGMTRAGTIAVSAMSAVIPPCLTAW